MSGTRKDITIGLVALLLADIPADGGMATTFPINLGIAKRDSVSLDEDAPETNELFGEGIDTPIFRNAVRGKETLVFNITNPIPDSLVLMFGGTVSGSGANKIWHAPNQMPVIEKAVQITPKNGMVTTYARMSLTAQKEYKINSKEAYTVKVSLLALIPEKEGVEYMTQGYPAA